MPTQSRRILLIGLGPLPIAAPEAMGFGQLRTQGFVDSLLAAGHTVALVTLEAEGVPAPALEGLALHEQIAPERAGWLEAVRAVDAQFGAEIIVSAGPYNPGRVAAAVADGRPFWMDVPGDPFAEAQAKAAFGADAAAAEAHARASVPGLLSADAFSVVSGAQRYALLGALGWSGRLSALPPTQRAVHVLPIAYDFGALREQPGRRREAGAPLTVALVGGFNTWFDTDTLLEGLITAMRAHPEISVICTGGEIEGHHTQDYARFCDQIRNAGLIDRVALHGWVPHDTLPAVLAPAHVLICLDRPGLEPELGGRTRVLFGLHQGLEVLANARCEQVRELATADHIETFPQGDALALTKALTNRLQRSQHPETVTRAQAYLRQTTTSEAILTPLIEWIDAPRRFQPSPDASSAIALQRESEALRTELDSIQQSPTWRTLGAVHRRLRRN